MANLGWGEGGKPDTPPVSRHNSEIMGIGATETSRLIDGTGALVGTADSISAIGGGATAPSAAAAASAASAASPPNEPSSGEGAKGSSSRRRWSKRAEGSSTFMAALSPSPTRKVDNLTGAVHDKPPAYTETALGGPNRTRLSTYDGAGSISGNQPRIVSARVRLQSWEFPGWGSHFRMSMPPEALIEIHEDFIRREHGKLGEWSATAICGNDILSSVLYVSGLVTVSAGLLSPICLAIVAGILYLYRFIYGEAMSALPLNGGSYNVLINSVSKAVASFAACLAVISYIATGVVSSSTAIAYLSSLYPELDRTVGTIVLLFIFACLTCWGITESAKVAVAIFVLHVVTLSALCVLCAFYAMENTSILYSNYQLGFPDVSIGGVAVQGCWQTALLFGVSSAMLGVSGFESSSQFIEEQAEGVFPKTLANMWMGVAVFNPVICALSFCVLHMDEITAHKDAMLAQMAERVGVWLASKMNMTAHREFAQLLVTWVSLDAFIVLSGALLTGYVGITGLIRRMASDRCLPQFLLETNKWRGTNHNIIFGFFFLATSQVLLLRGDIGLLSGVYTFAFLGVMSIFSVGCLALKFKRPTLPRDITTSYFTIVFGGTCVATTFLANVISKPEILSYFSLYFMAVGAVVITVFQRIRLFKLLLLILKHVFPTWDFTYLKEHISEIQNVPYIFFCKYDDLYVLNKAILYVRENEQTQRLLVVHVTEDPETAVVKSLSKHIEMFDTIYPKIKISLLTVTGHFGPAVIQWLHNELAVAKNKMFITALDKDVKYKINTLDGVRVITH